MDDGDEESADDVVAGLATGCLTPVFGAIVIASLAFYFFGT